MELIEEQYSKIIKSYPDAKVIDDLIYQIKIPLINNVFLEINYKKFPNKPKVIMVKSDGTEFKDLDNFIPSLKKWKKKNAPSITILIDEVFRFVKNMEINEIIIKEELLSGIMALCKEQHPREILGLLRLEGDIVSEFILPPGALTSTTSGIFFPNRLPLDPSLQGTVHSHPSGNPNPSLTDINDIFSKKRFHFIVAYPYNNLNCVKCFGSKGTELNFRIVN